MGDLLNNPRVLGTIVALIGGVTAFGVYVPGEEGLTVMKAVAAVCGAGALAAFGARFLKKKDDAPPSV
jgi:hypothetical protein